MDVKNNSIHIRNATACINQRVIFYFLLIVAISVIFSGCLAYLFSTSIITVVCSLIIGMTICVLANYFLLTRGNILQFLDFEFPTNLKDEDEEEITKLTTMKIE